jgi:antitoxin (DNA-binding transcriptional repressor) of toxin-antitoxin stability system
MRSVGLKALKSKLSEYVRLAASGETVLITDRRQVIAELVPAASNRDRLSDDDFLADLSRRGLLRAAKIRDDKSPPPNGEGAMPLEDVMNELAADREDR